VPLSCVLKQRAYVPSTCSHRQVVHVLLCLKNSRALLPGCPCTCSFHVRAASVLPPPSKPLSHYYARYSNAYVYVPSNGNHRQVVQVLIAVFYLCYRDAQTTHAQLVTLDIPSPRSPITVMRVIRTCVPSASAYTAAWNSRLAATVCSLYAQYICPLLPPRSPSSLPARAPFTWTQPAPIVTGSQMMQ
jgi:hypothetical protein